MPHALRKQKILISNMVENDRRVHLKTKAVFGSKKWSRKTDPKNAATFGSKKQAAKVGGQQWAFNFGGLFFGPENGRQKVAIFQPLFFPASRSLKKKRIKSDIVKQSQITAVGS